MKKKIILLISLLIIILTYTYLQYNNQKNKDSQECINCIESNLVFAQDNYSINFVDKDFNKDELIKSTINILNNGEIKKSFKFDNKNNNFNFKYNGLQTSDTIQVIIKDDLYYIYDFKNEFINYPKHNECELTSCKINNVNSSCIRGRFIISKKYSKKAKIS